MIQIILFPPHSFSSLPDEIKGLELFFCRVVSPFSLHFLERQAYLCWRHKCLFVVFTVHPLLWDLNYGVIPFTVQKVLSSCLEKPYLFADILVLCVTWIQQLLNFRLCSREVSRSQCGGKRKQLKLSVSYNSVAGITRVGDSCLVFLISFHLWLYAVIFMFWHWATFIHIYLTIIPILYDCLTACDASGTKTFLEKIIFLKNDIILWEGQIFENWQ